jgi:hypothetical protein
MTAPCGHLDTIADVGVPGDGCVTCLEIGSTWHHLRQCLQCGITLCCDSSPNRHMTRHHDATGHPIMRSGQPGEDWAWCYIDELSLRPTDGGGYESFDPFLETGAWYANQRATGGESLDLDEEYVNEDGYPLGQWLQYAREQKAKGELDASEVTAIESIPGWTW